LILELVLMPIRMLRVASVYISKVYRSG